MFELSLSLTLTLTVGVRVEVEVRVTSNIEPTLSRLHVAYMRHFNVNVGRYSQFICYGADFG